MLQPPDKRIANYLEIRFAADKICGKLLSRYAFMAEMDAFI